MVGVYSECGREKKNVLTELLSMTEMMKYDA